jgi:Iron-containing redox enzyme
MTPVQIEIEKTSNLQDRMLRQYVLKHPAASHPLFERLNSGYLTQTQAGSLLRNYDAHASHLRRLLLKAATIMPEKAVGYILENVRNEYGNGRADDRHQLQLQDLAWQTGISPQAYNKYAIKPGIKTFIKDVTAYYYPLGNFGGNARQFKSRAAVAAGAITATELLALEEFKSLQKAFIAFDQQHHIWFNHVTIECEHLEDSVSLALYFLEENSALEADVLFGLTGVLDATVHLYDGLLACLS